MRSGYPWRPSINRTGSLHRVEVPFRDTWVGLDTNVSGRWEIGLGRARPEAVSKPLGLAIVVCLLAIGAGTTLAPPPSPPSAITRSTRSIRRRSTNSRSTSSASAPTQGVPSAAEFARMRRGGIRTYRVPLGWSVAEPNPGKLRTGRHSTARSPGLRPPGSTSSRLSSRRRAGWPRLEYALLPHRHADPARPLGGLRSAAVASLRTTRLSSGLPSEAALQADPRMADLERGETASGSPTPVSVSRYARL